MLPVVFEEFEIVCIFFAFFFLFAIIANWLKVNFSKILGRTAAPPAPPPCTGKYMCWGLFLIMNFKATL